MAASKGVGPVVALSSVFVVLYVLAHKSSKAKPSSGVVAGSSVFATAPQNTQVPPSIIEDHYNPAAHVVGMPVKAYGQAIGLISHVAGVVPGA